MLTPSLLSSSSAGAAGREINASVHLKEWESQIKFSGLFLKVDLLGVCVCVCVTEACGRAVSDSRSTGAAAACGAAHLKSQGCRAEEKSLNETHSFTGVT